MAGRRRPPRHSRPPNPSIRRPRCVSGEEDVDGQPFHRLGREVGGGIRGTNLSAVVDRCPAAAVIHVALAPSLCLRDGRGAGATRITAVAAIDQPRPRGQGGGTSRATGRDLATMPRRRSPPTATASTGGRRRTRDDALGAEGRRPREDRGRRRGGGPVTSEGARVLLSNSSG